MRKGIEEYPPSYIAPPQKCLPSHIKKYIIRNVASRKWGMGRGHDGVFRFPLSNRQGGLGERRELRHRDPGPTFAEFEYASELCVL